MAAAQPAALGRAHQLPHAIALARPHLAVLHDDLQARVVEARGTIEALDPVRAAVQEDRPGPQVLRPEVEDLRLPQGVRGVLLEHQAVAGQLLFEAFGFGAFIVDRPGFEVATRQQARSLL